MASTPLLAVPHGDFACAAQAVLDHLARHFPLDLWMVTRLDGDELVLLHTVGETYPLGPGTVLCWPDSFCVRMLRGDGPPLALDIDASSAYASVPLRAEFPVKAYVGAALRRADGSAFGTLCGVHPLPCPDFPAAGLDTVQLLADLLAVLLRTELRAEADTRRAERLQTEALCDALTGVHNRRGWDRLMAAEEERCRRFGHPAALLVVDLDGLKQINDGQGHAAGDRVLQLTAQALVLAARSLDLVARLGGDEFGLIAVECDRSGGEALRERVKATLAQAGVAASIGLAIREPVGGLQLAWQQADVAMYEARRPRQHPAPSAGSPR